VLKNSPVILAHFLVFYLIIDNVTIRTGCVICL